MLVLTHTFIFRGKWEWRRRARGRLNQPKCPEVSAAWRVREGKKKGERMRGKSRKIEEETTRDISFRSRDERENETVRLTDGVETRCYVVFRNLVALELPPFLLSSLCVSASVFSPRLPHCSPLYFWSRFVRGGNKLRCKQRACFNVLPRTFSFSTEISIFKRYSP